MNSSTGQGFLWFFFEPYIYISIKKNSALLYNTLSSKILEYDISTPKIIALINEMNQPESLWVTKISDAELSDEQIKRFIDETRAYFMTDMIESEVSKTKPIQIVPKLNLQHSIDRLYSLTGWEIKRYLNELSFYINDHCEQDCQYCKKYYLQTHYCTKSDSHHELSIENLNKVFSESENSSMRRVNILGGNIFEHSKIKEIIILLNTMDINKSYYINYLNINQNICYFDLMDKKSSIMCILVHFPISNEQLKLVIDSARKYEHKMVFKFIVKNDDEIAISENVISDNKLIDYEIKPFYDGDNIDFFQKHVFINKEDIIEVKLNHRDIFARSVVNPLFFGSFQIHSNGSVYSNPNRPKLANIESESIYDIIFKEIYSESCWRLTRQKVRPCSDCNYCNLCPPLSNYELVIGQNNLCHVLSNAD